MNFQPQEESILARLMRSHHSNGAVEWIGLRTKRRGEVVSVDEAEITESGITGDHRSKPGARAVTLVQAEHLPVIAGLVGMSKIDPRDLRRNIVVSGINMLSLRSQKFQIGNAVLCGQGLCAPCSRMEKILGDGGYNAVRGHGGIIASVITPGTFSIKDSVIPLD